MVEYLLADGFKPFLIFFIFEMVGTIFQSAGSTTVSETGIAKQKESGSWQDHEL